MLVGEAHVVGFGPLECRPGEVAERLLVERDIRDDPHFMEQRLDVHASPVDFDHLARRAVRNQPVADIERTLQEQHQSRDDIAERLLQREADHDAAETQSRERAGDFLLPDLRINDRGPDGDQDCPSQVAEQFRDPLLPGAPRGRPEDAVIDEGETRVEQAEPEAGLHQPHEDGVGRKLPDIRHKQHGGQRRHHQVAERPQRGREGPVSPLPGIDQLRKQQQQQRKAHHQEGGGHQRDRCRGK